MMMMAGEGALSPVSVSNAKLMYGFYTSRKVRATHRVYINYIHRRSH